MKKSLLAVSIACSLFSLTIISARAEDERKKDDQSHFVQCNVNATILEVSNLARLNGSVVFSNLEGKDTVADVEQTVRFRIDDVVDGGPRVRCGLKAGDIEVLRVVKNEDLNKYKPNQKFALSFLNAGDFTASRITWTVLK